jgi:SET domain/WD domain, G-beta repeat
VAFSPDGRQLASASGDSTIRFWDPATGVVLRMLEDHSDSVSAVAFSPDGKQLASASEDETVRFSDSATGATVRILEGHSSWVRAVAFSPDGKQIATGSSDKMVGLWSVAKHERYGLSFKAPYEIRPSTSKGQGLFATRPIKRGSWIICEKPMFTALLPGSFNFSYLIDIYKGFSNLQEKEKNQYLQLHASEQMIDPLVSAVPTEYKEHARKAEEVKVTAIFETNAFNIVSTKEGEVSGIFYYASRINHSCSRNAHYTWNSRTETLNIHAIRDIATGEEITISYVPIMFDRYKRRSSLWKRYGFLCTCPACDDKISREGRQEICQLNQSLTSFLKSCVSQSGFFVIDRSGIEKTFNLIHKLIKLMLAEGLVGDELSWWYVYLNSISKEGKLIAHFIIGMTRLSS